MPELPRLAVVITCWNYQEYVGRAIASVLSQGREDCELIVVDDGSTDGSWDVIAAAGVNAFRIPNSGQRAACLYGFERTRAPFVLFLDADDELKPDSLAAIIAQLDPEVAKLQFALTRIDHGGRTISGAIPALTAFRQREELVQRVLESGAYATPPTSGNVFRRDVCELLREADYDRAVDGVILFAAPFMGDVVSLPDELGLYRVHDRNDSGLGRALDPVALQRDLRRFSARMEHLRVIAARYGRADEISQPQDTYFHLERSFYFAIATGQRPPFGMFRRLMARHWREQPPSRTKLAMAGFFLLAMALPTRRAKQGLAYRLNAGERTPSGLFKAVMR
ncbi:glycosyltransferase family 2 protein [Bosea sp. BH3]|uniref:glycosyltransferase family 2 protein n=1 Tax=Bosea sp. BH3 TaxID=2871701 RepID=UPI0021CB5DA1|nr:glycosyltransferase family 2 protein [Bosea sp. BH3]